MSRFLGPAGVLLGLIAAATGAMILASAPAAATNKGSFWLTNVGSMAAPKGVAHLDGSVDVNVVGSYPAESAGQLSITAWPPTGDGTTEVYNASWSYTAGASDPQVVAVIDVSNLFGRLAQAGFAPAVQHGYHLRIACTGISGSRVITEEFWITAQTAPTPVPTGGLIPPVSTMKPSVPSTGGAGIGLADTGGPLLVAGIILMLAACAGWAWGRRRGLR